MLSAELFTVQERAGKPLQHQGEEDGTAAQEREELSPPRAGRTQGMDNIFQSKNLFNRQKLTNAGYRLPRCMLK
jgi:hypothetical protein